MLLLSDSAANGINGGGRRDFDFAEQSRRVVFVVARNYC